MKKFLLLFSIIATVQASAQNPEDAIKFSWTVPSGTARHQAIGGVMGSLGGDITAAFINPAGLAFYRTSDGVLSLAYHFGKNRSTFLGRREMDKDGKFDLGTTGFVFGSHDPSRKNRSVALSLAFNTTANFKSNILYRGVNNQSSYSQKFIEELTNSGLRDSTITYLFPFGSSLAFNAYWIDPVKNSSGQVTGFSTNSPIATGLIQQQKISTRGGIYEPTLALGVNTNDKLMVGGSIGIPFLYYGKTSQFSEADATNDTTNRFDYAEFSDDLVTKGVGLNMKLGVIYKPKEYWRLGLAFHTPTLYRLTDSYTAQLTANTEGHAGIWSDYSKDYANGGASEFKYVHVTPYKVIGSISYVLREIQDVTKQKGFISADVEYVNYKASSYMTDPENESEDPADKAYLKDVNKAVDKAYKGAFNFRVGGELKFTTIMVRAGAAYYGNPYKKIYGGHGERLNLSGGLGYRNKGVFVDLTYVHSMTDDVNAPYRLQTGMHPVAKIRSTTGNVLLTVGFKF